jgi:hypothetical protein
MYGAVYKSPSNLGACLCKLRVSGGSTQGGNLSNMSGHHVVPVFVCIGGEGNVHEGT